jgi:aquaporin Z
MITEEKSPANIHTNIGVHTNASTHANVNIENIKVSLRVWWQGLNWQEYGAEFLGTAFLVFGGLSVVVFNFGPNAPLADVLSPSMRRLMTGLLFGTCGSLVAISPLGKLSGGHINPAVSIAFWLHGKLHLHDLVGYIVAQLLGACLGTALLVGCWGSSAASLHDGATGPGAGYDLWFVFAAEVAMTGLLVLLIFICVSHQRLLRWTPLLTIFLIGLIVWLEAPISGASLNPARSFGPSVFSGFWEVQWIYYIAPPLGAALAVGLYRLGARADQDVLTCKLFHVRHYRSIFKNLKTRHLAATNSNLQSDNEVS